MKTPILNTLREHRERLGLRQLDVACELGFNTPDRISSWEHGKRYPCVSNLIKMSKLYKTSVEMLYPDDITDT